jgi:hypothetical protein
LSEIGNTQIQTERETDRKNKKERKEGRKKEKEERKRRKKERERRKKEKEDSPKLHVDFDMCVQFSIGI